MSDEKKKKRAANFSSVEIDIMCDLVIKYSDIVESKKTDAITWKQKLQCWERITSDFNSKTCGLPRTMQSIKGKYELFKKELRKKVAQNKMEVCKTGGGSSKEVDLTPSEEKIYSLIILSVEGLSNRFGDDDLNMNYTQVQVSQSELSPEPSLQHLPFEDQEEIIYIQTDVDNVSEKYTHETNTQTEASTENVGTNCSKISTFSASPLTSRVKFNPMSLKKPVSKELQIERKANTITKLQASKNVSFLATAKKELIDLQIKYLKIQIDDRERTEELKLKKAEEELKSVQLDIEIKQIEKRIKEETLKKILSSHYQC